MDTQISHASDLISERAIDEPRPLKVIYIGAGISGVVASIVLPKHVPGIDLTIYDKNEDVGGTWLENKYPGCACDIPAHSYQLSFESNPSWSKFYAEAPEILRYWRRVVDKYNVRRFMKFKHKCVEARWDDAASKWHVKLQNLITDEVFEDVSDAIVMGTGALNDWKWPDIEGLHDFQGTLLHSAGWDPEYDPKDRKVAIIGGGSSGIQLVSALQPQVKSMDHYIRGRTWISTTFGHDMVRRRNDGHDGNFSFGDNELLLWKSDRDSYLKYRRDVEVAMQQGYRVTHRNSKEHNMARAFFESDMQSRLAARPEIATHLIPTFSPLCKRLTPGPGYLEALTASNVSVIPTTISHITSTGITTSDNNHHPVDTIICATGFNTSYTNRIPIYGRQGLLLDSHWTPRASTYLSVTTDSFPNLFYCGGPNSGAVTGNYVVTIEVLHDYIGQILHRLSHGNTLTIEPKRRAVQDFTDFCDAYFERTVFSESCSSWYRSPRVVGGDKVTDGRVSALWPGSSVHTSKALKNVRWEDFEFKMVDGKSTGWLGNGFTLGEVSGNDDELAWYLDHGTNLVDEDLEVFGVDSRGVGRDNRGDHRVQSKTVSMSNGQRQWRTVAATTSVELEDVLESPLSTQTRSMVTPT